MKNRPITAILFVVLLCTVACTSNPDLIPASGTTPVAAPEIMAHAASTRQASSFVLRSPQVAEGGTLPREYTCDGSSATLPLEWSGAPAGTESFAIVMHHIPPEMTPHWYWILYNIPANMTQLEKNVQGLGTLGNNSVNGQIGYSPPCSKGPGIKVYTYTVYALSAELQLAVPTSGVNRDLLLAAVQDITLVSATLNVTYSR